MLLNEGKKPNYPLWSKTPEGVKFLDLRAFAYKGFKGALHLFQFSVLSGWRVRS